MNREQHLQKTFPLEDGTTYIQSLDRSFTCEYSGLPSTESYIKDSPIEGVGDDSLKENFIDSAPSDSNTIKRSSDWMYNWIREKSGK